MIKGPGSAGAPVPAAGEGKRGEEGHLGYLLRQAAHAHRQRMDDALAGLGLTPPQFAALTMLAAYPGASNADLARLALLTPQTMHVIVANLARAGLVARRAHAMHGRIRHLALTEDGARRLQDAKGRVAVLEAQMSEGLPAEAERAIRRWLVGLAMGPRVQGEDAGAEGESGTSMGEA